MFNKLKFFLFILLLITQAPHAYARQAEVADYDPMSSYPTGMAWNFPPYLLVDLPPSPGDAIYSQGPIPRIAPFLPKSGWIPGHTGIFISKNKNKTDGTETYMAAEACRYGVWYVYFYPLYRFEKGHGRVDDFFAKNDYFARSLKLIPGVELFMKTFFKDYDSALDGTYMGARTLAFLEDNPNEYLYRRKIIEYANNCVLMNSSYNYEAFVKPLVSIFYSLNTQGTGQTGKGHNERYTCVGLVEAGYEYAGIDIIPSYAEETDFGVTPLKQFLYMKPVSRIKLKQGEKTNFGVWHVVNGKKTFNYGIKCSKLPQGCTFKNHNFKINSSLMAPGTYEVEFASTAFKNQTQKIKIIILKNHNQDEFKISEKMESLNLDSYISPELKSILQEITISVKNSSSVESDKKMLKLMFHCTGIAEAILIIKNIKNPNIRDIALLYSIGLAKTPEELHRLTNYTEWSLTTNKILFSPLGYEIAGIDKCLTRLINYENFIPFYEGQCLIELQNMLSGNYLFKQSVNIPLKISYNDIAALNESKIIEFIDYLCTNPNELNVLENSYLISLIQKRIYFAAANNDPSAAGVKSAILRLYKEYSAAIDIKKNNNLAIENKKLITARFLRSMALSADAENKWLEQAFLVEKNFLIAMNVNCHQIPGISQPVNELYSSSSDNQFNPLLAHGTLSEYLKDFILKNEGTAVRDSSKNNKEATVTIP
ncbi:MAG: hypothetical protein QMC67_01380 [Candidatus Wallbacteria bacterium]